MRRQLAKTAVRTPVRAEARIRALAGKAHFHSCSRQTCRLLYSCRCEEPLVNGRCHEHRDLRRPSHDAVRDPQPCCVENTFHVTSPEEIAAHELAGPGPWFRCKTCARSFGFRVTSPDPRATSVNPQESL